MMNDYIEGKGGVCKSYAATTIAAENRYFVIVELPPLNGQIKYGQSIQNFLHLLSSVHSPHSKQTLKARTDGKRIKMAGAWYTLSANEISKSSTRHPAKHHSDHGMPMRRISSY
jgi:hypothetical protein